MAELANAGHGSRRTKAVSQSPYKRMVQWHRLATPELGMQRHTGSRGCLASSSQKHNTKHDEKVDGAEDDTCLCTQTSKNG